VFFGVATPINTSSYSNSTSVAASFGNVYNTTGAQADLNAASVFTPPYAYTPDAARVVEAAVRSGAGPQ
jgi:hypothetical protein